jgi:hypothetical protein
MFYCDNVYSQYFLNVVSDYDNNIIFQEEWLSKDHAKTQFDRLISQK